MCISLCRSSSVPFLLHDHEDDVPVLLSDNQFSAMMAVLMYTPSVYNQSCDWSSSAVTSAGIPSAGNGSSASSRDWMDSSSGGLSSYDLFRCCVVLAVTCGLISGNLILALAVNCQYSAGILQFQVSSSSSFRLLPELLIYPSAIHHPLPQAIYILQFLRCLSPSVFSFWLNGVSQ